MAEKQILEGVFAINKPYGMSSAQVIRDCKVPFHASKVFKPLLDREAALRAQESKFERNRRSKNKKGLELKIGHGGTLDPMATGVLIIGVGRGTKSLSDFLTCTKTYETVVVFGADSDTYDRVGHVLRRRNYDHLTREIVEKELVSFRGTYQQMPPLFSALKMNGKPLYEYAREGKAIPREIETREVTVSELEMVEWYEPGAHKYFWPSEEATGPEKDVANSLWRQTKRQAAAEAKRSKQDQDGGDSSSAESNGGGGKMTPEEKEADNKAIAAHESQKRKFEQAADALIHDIPAKKRKTPHSTEQNAPLMSGGLGALPENTGKGANLIAPPDPDAQPPWEGKGPPAARIRITSTSGFYVRSFAHDLGDKVGSAGLMAELVRSRQNKFVLGERDVLEYGDLGKGEEVWGPKVEGMLRRWMNLGEEDADGDGGEKTAAEDKVGGEAEAEAKAKTQGLDEQPAPSMVAAET